MLCRIIVIVNIGGVELAGILITTGEKRPEDPEQNEYEDNARGDGDGDQDDYACSQEIVMSKAEVCKRVEDTRNRSGFTR